MLECKMKRMDALRPQILSEICMKNYKNVKHTEENAEVRLVCVGKHDVL